MGPESTLPVLDGTCECCHGFRQGVYRMVARCGNCGQRAVIILSRGHETPSWGGGPECPVCGNRDWAGWEWQGWNWEGGQLHQAEDGGQAA